jgi:hypothetical protein
MNTEFILFLRLTHCPFDVATAQWAQDGITVAGGNGQGDAPNQVNYPRGLFVDEKGTVIVADYGNHRIVEWKRGDTSGTVLAGGNGQGARSDQLNRPTDVIFDKATDGFIICDRGNRRLSRWTDRAGTRTGKTIIKNIDCHGLALDDKGSLYVTDADKHKLHCGGWWKRERCPSASA